MCEKISLMYLFLTEFVKEFVKEYICLRISSFIYKI